MPHYYTSVQDAEHDEQDIVFSFAGRELTFTTDSGTFSRERVDYGSELLIKSLPELSGRLLDMGSGWGAMALTLLKVNPELSTVMVEVNERAAELSRRNAKRLQVAQRAEIITGDGFSVVEGLFDTIITNPPIRAGKAVYFPWFEAAYHHLKEGGTFWCVVQKKQGAGSIAAELERVFGSCETVGRSAGFHVIKAVR